MRVVCMIAAVVGLSACGGDFRPPLPGNGEAAGRNPGAAAATPRSGAQPGTRQGARRAGASTARPVQLTNPNDETIVLLHYDVAGIAPPVADWAEEGVRAAPAPDKAVRRAELRARLELAAASVREVGLIRLTVSDARLSEYDPTYEEFTVQALAPSSTVEYRAYQQRVSLRFANGGAAQIWHVPQAESRAVRDRVDYMGSVQLDVLLRIVDAQPGTRNGTLTVQVVEYELRNRNGLLTRQRFEPAGR